MAARRELRTAAIALAAALAAACGGAGSRHGTGFEELEPGLELGRFRSCGAGVDAAGEPAITVVRVDPARFRLELLASSREPGDQPEPVRRWAERNGLVVATNAGMYHPDFRRHVGFMVDDAHVNNPIPVKSYKSALAFNPRSADLPAFVLADLDETDLDALTRDYRTVIQNLRMIASDGRNVWAPGETRTSVAALAIDGEGRLLFIHSRMVASVHELVACLLRLPLDIDRAQYLEGGSEAVLVVSAGGTTLELAGSVAAEGAAADPYLAWPIPNVLGVARRSGG